MEVVVDKEANIAHQEGSVPRNNSWLATDLLTFFLKRLENNCTVCI